MTAKDVVALVEKDGVRFGLVGGKLKLRAPIGELPGNELMRLLRDMRSEIIKFLVARQRRRRADDRKIEEIRHHPLFAGAPIVGPKPWPAALETIPAWCILPEVAGELSIPATSWTPKPVACAGCEKPFLSAVALSYHLSEHQ
jgi:hypothetical protein